MTWTRFAYLFIGVLCLSTQAGCYFSGGATTVSQQLSTVGTGFIVATEQNGAWDFNGPPPQVGDVSTRLVYRYLVKSQSFWLFSSDKGYQLSEPYPSGKYQISEIREVEKTTDNGVIQHYYQITFDSV